MSIRKEFLDAWFTDILRMQTRDQDLTVRSVEKRIHSLEAVLTKLQTRPFQVVLVPSKQELLPSLEDITSRTLRTTFFYSQYKLQRDENPDQAGLNLLYRVFGFINTFITGPPSQLAKDLVPTIFRWQPFVDQPKQIFIFFAIASPSVGYRYMMMRRYEVEELLKLRETLPFVILNLDNLTRDGDRAGILSYPRKAKTDRAFFIKSEDLKRFPTPRNMSSQSSLDEDDRIVFRGHSTRHAKKENLKISTKVAWQLHRSDNSSGGDIPSPLSAPSGEQAQKQENFHKFYRAVVSPTHVRVTAGGRIVPNTRAPPQPIFTWNRQKSCFESKKPAGNDGESVETFEWPNGVPLNDAQTNFRMLSPLASSPIFGTFQNPPSPQIYSREQTPKPEPEPTAQEPTADKDTAAPSTQAPPAIEISPPAQFDLTKPFLYNGQLVYPMPRGFMPRGFMPPPGSVLPVSMLGNFANAGPFGAPPGLHPPPAAPMYAAGPLGHPMQMSAQPMMLPTFAHPGLHGGFSQLPLGNVANIGVNSTGHQNAPIPSGEPVRAVPQPTPAQLQAMRLQVAGLRDYLKILDNQLTNNRHQINEAHVLSQHGFISQQITDLESRIASANESTKAKAAETIKNHPGNTDTQDQKQMVKTIHTRSGTVILRAAPPDKSTTVGGPDSAKKHQTPKASNTSEKTDAAKKQTPKASNTSEKTDAAKEPETATGNSIAEKTITDTKTDGASKTEHRSSSSSNSIRSKLSAAAALAPAFKPRNQVAKQSAVPSPAEVSDAKVSQNHTTDTGIPWSHFNPSYGAYQMSTAQSPQHNFQQRTPYLVGLPSSSHSFGTIDRGNEYIYPRELTEEELRARHLYWGKAPRELQKGLPKFDGKDFFPPSPTKPARARLSSHQPNSYEWNTSIPTIHHTKRGNIGHTSHESDRQQRASLTRTDSHDPFRDNKAIGSSEYATPLETPETQIKKEEDVSDDDTESLDSWDLPKNDKFPSFPTDITSGSHETMIRASPEIPKDIIKPEDAIENRSTTSSAKFASSFLQDLLKNPRYNTGLRSPIRNPLLSTHSTLAAPPSLSSTTAHGFLPHYGGLATASLSVSPPINSTPDRPLRHVGATISERFLSDLSLTAAHLPPTVPGSSSWQAGTPSSTPISNSKDAKEYLRILNEINRSSPTFVDKNLNPNSSGIGPVAPGEEW